MTDVFCCAGHVRVHARGERDALRDARPGKSPASDPLGAAGLRRPVHLLQKVLHHLPHHPVSRLPPGVLSMRPTLAE